MVVAVVVVVVDGIIEDILSPGEIAAYVLYFETFDFKAVAVGLLQICIRNSWSNLVQFLGFLL